MRKGGVVAGLELPAPAVASGNSGRCWLREAGKTSSGIPQSSNKCS